MINNNIKPLDPFNVNFKESLWDLNNIFINNIKEINDYTHHFEIYCPISLGHTIGNALRRTLLEISTEVAPLAIKIYHHESFLSPITGVKESVLNIIKNIKQLILSTSEDRMQMISIQCNKPGKVTSKNIINFDQINILNKDLYICELDKGASLRIDILVGSVNHVFNTNYQKLLDLRKYQNEYDEYIDTLNDFYFIPVTFNPVLNVNYNVKDGNYKGNKIDILNINLETKQSTNIKELWDKCLNLLNSSFSKIMINKKTENIFESLDISQDGQNILNDNSIKEINDLFNNLTIIHELPEKDQINLNNYLKKNYDINSDDINPKKKSSSILLDSIEILPISAIYIKKFKANNINTIQDLVDNIEGVFLTIKNKDKSEQDLIINFLNNHGIDIKDNN